MKTRYLLILTILSAGLIGCQAHSQVMNENIDRNYNEPGDTVQNDAAPPAGTRSLKLTLNGEAAGTTGDPSVLSERLEEVFRDREQNGVLKKDSYEVEMSVYLSADRSVPAEEMAGLFGVLNRSKADPVLIPVPVKEDLIKPNPLMLLVHAGSEEPPYAGDGIEIGFIGELAENSGKAPTGKDPVLIAASSEGTYTLDGKRISAADLKAVEKRLKAKEKGERTVVVRADNYGNMKDAAALARAAGAGKVYFVTENKRHNEDGISFSLSPALYKIKDPAQIDDHHTVRYEGAEDLFMEITTSDTLVGREEAESEIDSEYELRKRSLKNAEVSKTETDGSSGVLSIETYKGRYFGYWQSHRRKDGKHQPVVIRFSCERKGSVFCGSEFLRIIGSIGFN